MIDNQQQLINLSKDILYLVGSILGIIGFIRTFKKREYCSFNYKTDFGNEVEPYLICLRSNMYNLKVSNSKRAVFVVKYPSTAIASFENRKTVLTSTLERASFFPLFKEEEFLVIDNNDFKMDVLYFEYEDKYQNKYKQQFSFDSTEIGNNERIKRTNRSCYLLSKRQYRFMFIWLPLFKRFKH